MPPNPSVLEAVLFGTLGVFVGTASLTVDYCQYRATTRLADVELGTVTQAPSASGTDAAMDAPEMVNNQDPAIETYVSFNTQFQCRPGWANQALASLAWMILLHPKAMKISLRVDGVIAV